MVDVNGICEPTQETYNDFSDGKVYPDSVVAKIKKNWLGPNGEISDLKSDQYYEYYILNEEIKMCDKNCRFKVGELVVITALSRLVGGRIPMVVKRIVVITGSKESNEKFVNPKYEIEVVYYSGSKCEYVHDRFPEEILMRSDPGIQRKIESPHAA